jgi:RNA polymerase sigma factor (sigma-70 family)
MPEARVEPSNLNDEELLRQANENPAAFAELYRRHVRKITSFAARRCSTPHEVPDLVAAMWLEVIEAAPRFDARRGKALPWILGVAANLTASHARRKVREREALQRLGGRRVLDDDDLLRLEEQMDAARTGTNVRRALSQLPPAERALAELVLLDGLSPREAAQALSIRPTAARMRLARARSKLTRAVSSFRVLADDVATVTEVSH